MVHMPPPKRLRIRSFMANSVQSESSARLSRSDSFTILSGLVGLFVVIYIPQLPAKIVGLIGMCLAVGWFVRNSHWTHQWSSKKRDVVSGIVIFVMLLICIPQFVGLWEMEHSSQNTATPVTGNASAQSKPTPSATPIKQKKETKGAVIFNNSSDIRIDELDGSGYDNGVVTNHSKDIRIGKVKINKLSRNPTPPEKK